MWLILPQTHSVNVVSQIENLAWSDWKYNKCDKIQ